MSLILTPTASTNVKISKIICAAKNHFLTHFLSYKLKRPNYQNYQLNHSLNTQI